MTMKRPKQITLLAGALIVGFLLRGCFHAAPDNSTPETQSEKPQDTLWTCSMHPQIKLPEPGNCPICFMDLIPLEAGDDELDEREIHISPYAAKLMEIETVEVVRQFASAEIRMAGKVDYDETRVSYIATRIPGRIDRLYVDYTGIPVKKGDHLAELYSPELLTAQQELLQAIETLDNLKESQSTLLRETADQTIKAAREKLRLWGFSQEQIAEIEQRGRPAEQMTIYSPAAGIVIHKNAQTGMYVQTGTRIYTIADLSVVWVQIDAYESDLKWLRYGSPVEFTTESHPGETFKGTISFIEPVISQTTRTAKVRLIVDNADGRLKPGMFVRAVARPRVAADGGVLNPDLAGKWISPMHPEIVKDEPGSCDVCGMPLVTAESLGYVTEQPQSAPLLIPTSAALKTGRRAVVYVEKPGTDKRAYEGREVVLGARLGDFYIVKEGLEAGERVVTRGNFKLDAELQIQAKPSMMSLPGEMRPEATAEHDHPASISEPLTATAPFIQQLSTVLSAYYTLHEALAADDSTAAKSAAENLKSALEAVDMSLLDGKAHEVWMDHLKGLNAALRSLIRADELVPQREAFHALSQQLAKTVQLFPLGETVYQAYCPMAFDDTGAIWLQPDEKITNPYFGDMMLRCGEIQKTFDAREAATKEIHE
jgi:membrane fusion protein, copper/silver efflux system